MNLRNIYRVKDSCSLEYPNGECWARRRQFVYIDWDDARFRNLMHGQESKVRNITRAELEAGGEVVPIDPKFATTLPGYRPEQDRMFRLTRPDVVSKGRAIMPPPTPIVDDEPEGEP